jgi:hypothetical protein
MLNYSSLQLSDITSTDWDEFIDEADNGTIFHTRQFLSYHPIERFTDASLAITKRGNIFAVVPAVILERNGQRILSSHGGASYGGFVYRKDLNIADAHEIVETLIQYAHEQKCNRIQLTPPPIIYQSKYSNYIDFALVRNGFSYVKREVSSVVQLDIPQNKLLTTYRQEARTAIKKSQKQGVVIAETDQFAEYYEILSKNLKMRHNVTPTHSLEELLKIKAMFPTKVRLWGAFVDGKLIAGVCNFSCNPRVVLAFYISHDEDYQEYRAVNLLFYEIMKQYQSEGFNFLDFGIFTVNMEPNWGLGRFKENFGSRGIFRDTFGKDLI